MENSILIQEFITSLFVEKDISQNTVICYKKDLELLFIYLNDNNLELNTLSLNDIEGYVSKMKYEGYSPSSMRRKIASLRSFFKFLFNDNHISYNPSLYLSNIKKGKNLPKYLLTEEIDAIFRVCENGKDFADIRNSTILELIYSAGLRVSEVLNIKLQDILTYKNEGYITIVGKGNKKRIAPLTEKSISMLEKYLAILNSESNWLFPKDLRGRKCNNISVTDNNNITKTKKTKKIDCNNKYNSPMTRQRFGQILKELSVKAGINPNRVSPHILRHSFATHMIARGVNIKIVQEILGHSDISSTQIYTHTANTQLKQIIDEHHPIDKIR